MGERLERFNARLVDFHKPLQFLLLLLGCIAALATTVVIVVGAIYAIPAIKEWHHANAATTNLYEKGLGELKDAAYNVKEATGEIAPTLKALQGDAKEAEKQIKQNGDQVAHTLTSVTQRLETFDTVLVSLRSVGEETKHQIKQNGDEATKTLASLNKTIADVDTQVTQLGSDGSSLLKTANSRIAKVLDDFDVVIVGPDGLQGLIKKGNYIADEAGKTTHNVNLLTADIQLKEHSVLFAPPDKGFTGFMKKYILRPITTFGGAAYLVERLLYNLP